MKPVGPGNTFFAWCVWVEEVEFIFHSLLSLNDPSPDAIFLVFKSVPFPESIRAADVEGVDRIHIGTDTWVQFFSALFIGHIASRHHARKLWTPVGFKDPFRQQRETFFTLIHFVLHLPARPHNKRASLLRHI